MRDRNDIATTADIARRAGLTYEQGNRMIEAIIDELALGRMVRLQGLGIFRVSHLAGREFETPITPSGKARVPARKVIRFKRSPTAAKKINGVST